MLGGKNDEWSGQDNSGNFSPAESGQATINQQADGIKSDELDDEIPF
jgi:hypothetical protein